MKYGRAEILALAALATLTCGAKLAEAQTTGNGPYYAAPSWDQTLPVNTRFIVLSNFNNQAVLDRETGLVWLRSPGGGGNYLGATTGCQNLSVANRMGWRLPTVQEMMSLIDQSTPVTAPQLPTGHPFTGLSTGPYWTATQSPVPPGGFYTVRLNTDLSSPTGRPYVEPIFPLDRLVDLTFLAWCVRTGEGANPQ